MSLPQTRAPRAYYQNGPVAPYVWNWQGHAYPAQFREQYGLSDFVSNVGGLASLAGGALGAYHGYKRNNGSVGWAVGWAVLGSMFPLITGGIAVAQGIGRPKGR